MSPLSRLVHALTWTTPVRPSVRSARATRRHGLRLAPRLDAGALECRCLLSVDSILGTPNPASGVRSIDGTGNLVHGLPLWAISIGLLDAGEPVLGVISIPPLGELYWAVKGGGAWRDGVRLEAHDADSFHTRMGHTAALMLANQRTPRENPA